MKQGWEYKKLGEVCTIERGGSPRPITDYITDSEDGINWIKIGDAQEGSKYITSTKEKIRLEGLKKSRFVHKGDFILSNSMSFGRPYILKVDGCIHDGWLVIHDDKEVFIKDYLYYILSSPIMYAKFSQLAVGGVVNNLNSSLVRKVTIPLPPKSTQLSIVSELDKINELIRLKKEQLKDYDNLAQSIFYEMFGDPVENEKGWEVKKIGEIGSVERGAGISKKDFVEDGLPCIHYGQLHTILGARTKKHYTSIPYDLLPKYKVAHTGDLVMAITSEDVEGSCKSTAWLGNYDVIVGSDAAILHHKQDGTFLSYYTMTKAFYNEKAKYAKGFKVTHISTKEIEKISVFLPPLPLQHLFAQRIEQIERQKSAVQKSITDLETLLASRMQYWFE